MAVIIIKPDIELKKFTDNLSSKRLIELKVCGVDIRFHPTNTITYVGSKLYSGGESSTHNDHPVIIIVDINDVLPFKSYDIIPRPIDYIDDPKCTSIGNYTHFDGNTSLSTFMNTQYLIPVCKKYLIYPNGIDVVILLGNDYYITMLPLHPRAKEHPKICKRKRLRITQFVMSFLIKARTEKDKLQRAIDEITMETGPITGLSN